MTISVLAVSHTVSAPHQTHTTPHQSEQQQVDWLISLFNQTFAHTHTQLVSGEHEPEYFPATTNKPAQIVFAHGYFASALHEISHWCIAGKYRRTLPDFGYWYAPDGRSASQQQQFEQVEIKPQAIECLFTTACNKRFFVSQDNLTGAANPQSTFKADVKNQALVYIRQPHRLPTDAQLFFNTLQTHIRRNNPVTETDITKQFNPHSR